MHVFMHDVHERVFCVYDMYVLVCVWGECIYGCICIFVYVYMWCMCVWVCLCVSVLYMDDVCVCVCYVIWHIWEEDNIQLSFPFVALLRQGQHKASPCCPDITSHHWKASLSSIVQAILLINLDIRLQSACCFIIFWICLLLSRLPYLKFRPLLRLLWKLIKRYIGLLSYTLLINTFLRHH